MDHEQLLFDPNNKKHAVAVIVAHPDDETLWAGGTILLNPGWTCFVLSLCRGSDPDRALKFYKVVKALNAEGAMADLDDGPDQTPLDETLLKKTILDFLPPKQYSLVVTHHPAGEYTRHRRHEEISRAVIQLWQERKIDAGELWTFAYEDGGKKYFPKPVEFASIYQKLPESVWQKKYNLMTQTYGYAENSWEAQTVPRAEAFWRFTDRAEANEWMENGGSLI